MKKKASSLLLSLLPAMGITASAAETAASYMLSDSGSTIYDGTAQTISATVT